MAINVSSVETERLVLRNISEEDTDSIVRWRSDPTVFCYFTSPHAITIDEHRNWYINVYLNDENRIDWMALDEQGDQVGVFGIRRESRESDTAEISYILNPKKKGKGYAKEAVKYLFSFLVEEWKCKYAIAEIHQENKDSIKFAINQGMELESQNEAFSIYKKNLVKQYLYNKKKVFIRTDGNDIIGMGHVMRCLSIAEQLRTLGAEVAFVVSDDLVCAIIKEHEFDFFNLHTAWNKMEQEIEKLCYMIIENKVDVILVDSYFVTEKYFRVLGKYAKVCYIDDFCKTYYPVNMLINYNVYACDTEYEKFNYPNIYLGVKYVPLRKEFIGIEKKEFRSVKNIFITSGGTDEYNVVGNILETMKKNNQFENFQFYCVLGRFNKNLEQLNIIFKEYSNVHFLIDINNMSDYMMMCDIAITAGGTTCYELCACGLPSIVYTLADNQFGVAKAFSELEIIPYVGDVRSNMEKCMKKICIEIDKLMKKSCWKERSEKMRKLVDGLGAQRIARSILEYENK